MRALKRICLENPVNVADESDEALMIRLMEGSLDAFNALHARHAGRLRMFVMRFVGDHDHADDLVQEIFLKLYRNPKAFDPRGRFLTWVYAVARNKCIDFLRLKRLPSVPMGPRGDSDDEPVIDPVASVHHGPMSEILQREMEGRVQQVVATLSPKLREVFVLCALQSLSYEEAAEIIGCPVKTVSSRLSRARDRFLERFRPFLDEPGDAGEFSRS